MIIRRYRSIAFVLLMGLVCNSGYMCADRDKSSLVDVCKPLVYMGAFILCLKYQKHKDVCKSSLGGLMPLLSVICLVKFIDSL